MKRYLSIVLALLLLMSSLPINASVQTEPKALLDSIDAFNQESVQSAPTPETTEKADEEAVSISVDNADNGQLLDSELNLGDANFEREVLDTIPVTNDDEDTSCSEDEESAEAQEKDVISVDRARELREIENELKELNANIEEYAAFLEECADSEEELTFDEPETAEVDAAEDSASQESVEEDSEQLILDIDAAEPESYDDTIEEDAGSSQEEAPAIEAEDTVEESYAEVEETVDLMATTYANYTVSGTVYLPAGTVVSAGSQLTVYLYEAPVIENGRVVEEKGASWSKTINLTYGQTAANFAISVPFGDYIIAVRFRSGNRNIVGKMYYYTAGGLTPNENIADVITVNRYLSGYIMTLPKAESYISGTIDFSDCVPTVNSYINVYAYDADAKRSRQNYRAYIYVPAGTTQLAYELGVDPGAYEMQINGDFFDGGYYTNGMVDSTYRYRSIIQSDNGIDGLDVCMSPFAGDDDDTEYETYNVTLNLSTRSQQYREYLVALMIYYPDEDYLDMYDAIWTGVDAGAVSVTEQFYLPRDIDGDIYVAYKSMDNIDTYTWAADSSFRYYSSALGVVGSFDAATQINGNLNVIINEPVMVSVSGNISVNSDDPSVSIDEVIYVGAEFADEIYVASAVVSDGTYTLTIPRRLLGQGFEMFTARMRYSELLEDTMLYNEASYTLQASQSINVNAGDYSICTGNVYLPTVAPNDGINIELDVNDTEQGFVILPGEDSLEYSFAVSQGDFDPYAYAYIIPFEPVDIFWRSRVDLSAESDFYFEETATISGTVSLPQGLTFDEDVSFEIEAEGRNYTYAYRTIMAGETQTTYELKVPAYSYLESIGIYLQTEDLPLVHDLYVAVEEDITEDTVINLNLETAAVISGTVSLPEDAFYEDGEVRYNVRVRSVNTGITYEHSYRTYSPYSANEFSITVPSGDDEYYLSVYVYNTGNSSIEAYEDAYYVSDYVIADSEYRATPVTPDGEYHLSFPIGKLISGTVMFPDGAFTEGSMRAEIVAENAQTYDSRYDDYVFSDTQNFDYNIVVPAFWTDVNISVYIYQHYNQNSATGGATADKENRFKTNISFGEYYYNPQTSSLVTDEALASSLTLQEGTTEVDLELLKATKATGTIVLPSDFRSLDTFEFTSVYFEPVNPGRGYDTTVFVDSARNYEMYIPAGVNGEYILHYYQPYGICSNIVAKQYTYADATGAEAILNITPGVELRGINLAFETGYTLSGTVSLPQDVILSDTTEVSINMYTYGDNYAHVYLDSENKSAAYMVVVPKDMEGEVPLSVNVYYHDYENDSASTNLLSGSFYYAENGTLTQYAEDAKYFSATGNVTGLNFALTTGIPVEFTVSKPSNLEYYVSGQLYIIDAQTQNQCAYQYFSIDWDEDDASYSTVLPKDMLNKQVYVYYYLYSSGELYGHKSVYINPDGTYSKTLSTALPHTITEDFGLDFIFAKTEDLSSYIKGTISFEDGCILEDDGYYYAYVWAYNTSNRVGTSKRLDINSTEDIEYTITLSEESGSYNVYVEVYPGGMSNICTNDLYYTPDGVVLNRNEAAIVSSNSTGIDIEVPKLSAVSGKVVVDENYKSLEPMENINLVLLSEDTGSEKWVDAYVDEDMNYTAYVPYDVVGNYRLGLRVDNGVQNNLDKTTNNYIDYSVYISRGEDIEDMDIEVATGYEVSGILRLPNGIEIPEDEEMRYTLELGNSYANLTFDDATTEVPFMFGLPVPEYSWNSGSYKMEGQGDYYGNTGIGNLYLGNAFYGEDGEVGYNWYDASYITVSSDITDLDICIPTGLLVEFNMEADSSISGMYVNFAVKSVDGNFDNRKSIYYNKNNGTTASIVLPEIYFGEEIVIGYECDTSSSDYDYYIPWYVFLNEDGNFYSDESQATVYNLMEELSFDVVLPHADDVIYPEAVMQSAHPYENNLDEIYTYTHPTEADGLMITFSENTQTESYYDKIYITDANGNQVGDYNYYTGTQLAGKVMEVPGNSFNIRFTTDGGGVYYGFAVVDVAPIVYHTVTFKNYDGTILETKNVLHGSNVEYTGLTPEKPSEDNTSYVFTGWDKSLYNIIADTEFTAQYEAYTVYLESDHPYSDGMDESYPYTYPGEAEALRITFSAETQTENRYDKIYIYDGNNEIVYNGSSSYFTGNELSGKSLTVTGNSFTVRLTSDGSATRYGFAVIGVTPVKDRYTVTFKNYDGTVLSTVTVPAGASAVYDGETPVKPNDGTYEYQFTGWNKDTSAVYYDMEVTAQFEMAEYVTVTYKNYDGSILYSEVIRKGSYSTYKAGIPYRPIDDNGYGYIFTGWSKDLGEVYRDTVVLARFSRRNVVEISTEAELRAIADDLDGVYVLRNDIELTDSWTPVGTPTAPFEGVFDGNGYSISNINIGYVSGESEYGFFGCAIGSVLRNMNLEVAIDVSDVPYYEEAYVGTIAATLSGSDVRNVHAAGSIISGGSYQTSTSGFADEVIATYIDGASSTVDISNTGCVAGFSAWVSDSQITNSYYNGNVTIADGDSYVYGFACVDSEGETTIDYCYSNFDVELSDETDVEESAPFAIAYVETEGAIFGGECYYNEDLFTLGAISDEADALYLGTPLTDAQMKDSESFVGFDFDTMWEIKVDGDGYPSLSAAGNTICAAHEYTEWERISDPTCEVSGYNERTCTKCGRVERQILSALGHDFGDWNVIKEPDVLSEGEKTRQCSVCYFVEVEFTEKTAVDLNDPNYGLVHFTIVDAITLAPIENAQIFISTDNDGENTFFTDDEGMMTQVLPIGNVNVSVYKSGYLTRRISINVVSGEQNVPTIGISTKPLVDVQLSSKVMSYDEIINAGIDVNAPGNNHVVKYNVTLKFGTESADIVTYFNGNHSCVGNYRVPVHLSTGTVYVYPVSETFYLMVYGEVQWLKEMFDVEMLIMNNSNTDIVTQCSAELVLPDGLSLAEMVEEQQTLKQEVPDIGHSQNHSVHWYVRGDVAGEYNIGANLKAVLSPLGDIIDQQYTLQEPIKVYAGNAMHMDIYVPDMTFYGDSYPIKIELTNVSDRTLYNVSNSIKYFKQGKVTHYSNGVLVNETYFAEDSLASIGSSEFKPGDKISIEVEADIEFRTNLIRAGFADIKEYVGNIDDLLKAYEAYITGAQTVNTYYASVNDLKSELADVIIAKAYTGEEAETAQLLLTAVTEFANILKGVSEQKAVDLINKLKTTGVYAMLEKVCANGDVFTGYRTNRISKFAKTIAAIISSENVVEDTIVTEEKLFKLLARAIESIPIKYYLEDVLVSTLEGSTTSIPYTVHVVSTQERFFSIDRLDKYLDSVIQTAVGHIDSPWLMGILKDSTGFNAEAEEVVLVKNEATKFAASDNKGDVVFKVWTDDSAAATLSVTNETAVFENGVLTFTGAGYISVEALEVGDGVLYIQAGDEIKQYSYTVVDEHTCEGEHWITVVSPQEDADGYKVKYCDICHEIIAIETHEPACDNHVYGDYVVEKDANGEELGIKHRTCEVCGRIQYLVIDEEIDYMEFILTPESYLDIVAKEDGEGSYLKQTTAGITAAQIKSHFENNNIEVILADGTSVTAESKIGTGNKLVIDSQDGTTSAELTVIVKGDTTGEGNLSVRDMVSVFNHVQNTILLSGDYLEAAYVNSDRRVSVADLVLMFNAIQSGGVLK